MPAQTIVYGQTQASSHVLQPGENSLDLELFYNITKPDLDAMNGGQDLALAGAGQQVKVSLDGVSAPAPSAAVPATPAPAAPSAAPRATDANPAAHTDPPGSYTVQRGDTLFRIATQYGLPMSALAAANNILDADTIYVGQVLNLSFDPSKVQPLAPPPTAAPAVSAPKLVPAPNAPSAAGKQILVVLHEQMVYVYQDGQLLRQFLASTGLPGTPTVLGKYAVYVKYDAERMVGPGYDLPGVPWVMYFYRGYALHGTYWHNNFGHPMSHGCVNLRTGEAEWLYEWAPVGTPVTVIS
jgi:lipoprotein-anchoring transpeptidase ErfK/SrfK